MNIQIKKADSVTSILLFLFNVFLVKKGIRELSVKKIITLLEPFGKSETAIRMGLSRGVRNGVLVNSRLQGEVYYGITSSADEHFKYWWELMERFQAKIPMQHAAWDGTWTMVFIKRDGMERVLSQLKKQGYGSLDRSLWVSPYSFEAFIDEKVEKSGDRMYIFRSKLAEDLKPEELIKGIWNPQKLNDAYKQLLDELEKAFESLQSNHGCCGNALPFLHLLGLRLFDIIQEDPQLPLELLPEDWKGVEAAKKFQEFREKYLPESFLYVDQIIG